MSGLLDDKLLANIGRQSEPKRELVTRRDIRKYAVATGNRQRKYLDGDEAPPMFVFGLFRPLVGLDRLKPDGLAPGAAMPELPLKRTMAGAA